MSFRGLKTGHKLAAVLCSFIVPIAFVLWALVSEQDIAIDFAGKELLGARYLLGLAAIQGDVAGRVVGAPPGIPDLTQTLSALDAPFRQPLETALQADAAIAALRDPAGLDSARPKLRDLITRIGDRSNLILDNVLCSYYLIDVGLNRLPDIIDRIADLGGMANSAKDAEARAQFLVAVGGLQADLDGMDTSLTAAEQADGGQPIRQALDAEYRTLKTALDDFAKALQAGTAPAHTPAALLDQTTRFSQHAAREAQTVMELRLAALHGGQLRILGYTTLLFAAAFGLTLFTLWRGVSRPLGLLRHATQRLSGGDLDTALPEIATGDELGAMARALKTFRDQGRKAHQLAAETAETALQRERTRRAVEVHTAEFGTSVAAVLDGLRVSAVHMRRAVDQMGQSVERTRADSAATADGARDSARNLAAVAAATEQLSASAEEITRQIAEAAVTAEAAVQRARQSDSIMDALHQAAASINEIVTLIDDIAQRTNLLALNATIESARAGEHGKGFAVVAHEVKELAGQTSKAIAAIAPQIAAIKAAADQATDAVRGTGDAITQMHHVSSTIAAAVEEQRAATREIAASVQHVVQQTGQAVEAMKSVSGVAEVAGNASRSVLNTAEELARSSDALSQEVDQFMSTLRADLSSGHADPAASRSAA